MKTKRIFLTLGAVVLIGTGVTFAAGRSQTSTTTAQTQTSTVTRATLSSVIESSGSATPETSITLSFGATGTVDKVNVRAGDQVKKGDVLAEIDTTDLQLAVAQAEQAYVSQQATYSMTVNPDPAEVAADKLAVSNAEAAYQLAQQTYKVNSTDSVMLSCVNLDNLKKSYDDAQTAYNNYISDWHVTVNGTAELSPQKSQLDRAKSAYEQAVISCNLTKSSVNDTGIKSAYASLVQAKANLDNLTNPSDRTLKAAAAQLEQVKLALDEARQQLEGARIVAPFDGLVTSVTAVAGGPSSSAAIKLSDASQYHVDVLVDETEIGRVQAGQQAKITFDALTGITVTGQVARIDPAGTVSNGVVNYKVRVNLDPTDAALRTDMTANVQMILDTHTNVLAVPGTAIRSGTSGGYYVNVAGTDGTAQRVDVTTGYTDGSLTEVSGNLQAGQKVYLGETTTTQKQQNAGFNLFGLRIGG